ncbi:ornithine cyclodeaminase family protein [Photobacterium sanguinicancri]|uniref:ornithine cyclodeaminase family protein n=1 Tax=Photobacterium sanguinicancri TaxID=875932 RepID=UPI0021C4664F|nr:ornithine cyclodeaminase family protein [Photobacterium sanguinicancri]
MKIINKQAIEANLPDMSTLMAIIKQCYIDFSDKKYVVPPVGHMPLPNGELHIKYGISDVQKYAAIKIASGSYTNHEIGLPNSYGCIMVINANTGFPEYMLQDEGILTDHRTAAAGALMAQTMIGDNSARTFGIVGCGIQGYFQSVYTCHALGINQVLAYDIKPENIQSLTEQLAKHDIELVPCKSIKALCESCDVITTVTPATSGYIIYDWLKPNAHINAFGCDTEGKQELTENVLQNASLILADSLAQCSHHGELQYLYNDRSQQHIKRKSTEFGTFFKDQARFSTSGLTIADFTGIAPQDIAIANAVIKQ